MNRILLFVVLLSAGVAGCAKTNDVPAQIRAQLAVDDKIITDYLSKNNIAANSVDSAGVATGIRYKIDTAGTGNDLYTSSTSVTVSYTGTLLTTGTQFVSSGDIHPSYILGETIRGWQLGLPHCKKGGTITLYLPSHYAYGPFAQPSVGLPANAVLIFRITVYNITN
ncbi:MAG: FKBP-type peptidyl-prolyl cis-trans isomerase [Mucilaginibacter sp.]